MRSRSKGRVTLVPLIALSALSAVVAIPALAPTHLFAAAPQRYSTVIVGRGENLWAIADRYTAEGQNPQETIDRIEVANHLTSATIVPGERLRIPR